MRRNRAGALLKILKFAKLRNNLCKINSPKFHPRSKIENLFQIMIGEDVLLRFSGVPLGEACTIVIRGATQQILDEAERSLHDALCVLAATVRESRIVYGGGKKRLRNKN